MGKRRIRCLQSLGYKEIVGIDPRRDRREETERLYAIKTSEKVESIDISAIDAIIISTPPDKHLSYIEFAVSKNKPVFVEASVILDGLETINKVALTQGVLIAPSCTLRFHPAIKDIKQIVHSGFYGKVTNFTYHSGQYLPDWHPWENVKDFYVSQQETGGGREIVPFELTWIVDILGYPVDVQGLYGKTMNVGADIDDTYVVAMRFKSCYGSLLVDVVARYAVRNLILNMEYGQILWNWDDGVVKLYDANTCRWIYYHSPQGQSVAGYNKNLIEEMYIEELYTFIDAVKGNGIFPNTLDDDIEILKLLERIERQTDGKR
ncbi:MAG: Gfo/Idh/MocA family oxidoreductase [Nitrospirae bacterium]|nr:Gfo/Idh/MocA family oxidoreductase [Nitrospirota bacterium]